MGCRGERGAEEDAGDGTHVTSIEYRGIVGAPQLQATTAAFGAPRTDWHWALVFSWRVGDGDAQSRIPVLGRRFESLGPRKQKGEVFETSPFDKLHRREYALRQGCS